MTHLKTLQAGVLKQTFVVVTSSPIGGVQEPDKNRTSQIDHNIRDQTIVSFENGLKLSVLGQIYILHLHPISSLFSNFVHYNVVLSY